MKFILPSLFLILSEKTHYVIAHQNDSIHYEDVKTELVISVIIFAFFSNFLPILMGYGLIFFVHQNEKLKEFNFTRIYALSFGFSLFLFYDYVNLSGYFSLTKSNIVFHSGIILISIITLFFLYFTEQKNQNSILGSWAVGMGIHSFAEGIIMGYNFTLGIVAAFQLFPILSFLIHKVIEGFIGTTLFLGRSEPKISVILKYSLIAGIPAIGGVLLGYLIGGINSNLYVGRLNLYLFSTSVALIIFILPKTIPILNKNNTPIFYQWSLVAILIFYFGVILHVL